MGTPAPPFTVKFRYYEDHAIQTPTTKLFEQHAPTRRAHSIRAVVQGALPAPAFLTGAVLIALAIRLIVVAGLLSNVSSHTMNYNDFGWESWEMGWVARSLMLGHGFSSPFLPITGPTALVPPLYPYILGGMFHFLGVNSVKVAFAVLGFNSLCSSLTCIPLYFVALHALNLRGARLVACAWAVYPFAIYFSAHRVWDYALTSLLFSCCLLVAQTLQARSWLAWFGFGALYGLTVLSNPSVVSLFPFFLLIAIYRSRRVARTWMPSVLAAVLALLAVCAPWQIRNERVMHANFFVRDGFWLEFYAGNNGDTSESNSSWAHPASNPVEMKKYQDEGEIGYMAEKRGLAMQYVKAHPVAFAGACARRVLRFWTGFWSFRPSYLKYEIMDVPNVPFCLFLLYGTVLGLRRWWREDRDAALPYLMAVLVFPLPYYLTHSSMDYRQPLEPIVVLLVTVGLFGTGHGRRQALRLASSKARRETYPEDASVLV